MASTGDGETCVSDGGSYSNGALVTRPDTFTVNIGTPYPDGAVQLSDWKEGSITTDPQTAPPIVTTASQYKFCKTSDHNATKKLQL